MLIRYKFASPTLNFDGRYLSIEYCSKILKFANISDFNIQGSKVSFSGDYMPEKYEIIKFKLKDNPIEHLGRFIKFTHDRTGIKVDFSFDNNVQSPHIKPICYSDVEMVTFTKINDNIIYRNILKSLGYIHDEKTGIIKKDVWIPKDGDIYYFIDSHATIARWLYDEDNEVSQDHVHISNCFKTEAEAEIIKNKFLQLLLER